jgi:hypothetical protein
MVVSALYSLYRMPIFPEIQARYQSLGILMQQKEQARQEQPN